MSGGVLLVVGESVFDRDADVARETLGAESETGAEAEAEALDAYSRTVAGVVDRLAPSVANLRVLRATRRGRVGVAGGSRPLPSRARRERGQPTGVEVIEVTPGSPAEQAGLRAEDLIIELAGSRVHGVDDIQRLMVADLIDAQVDVLVLRGGEPLRLPFIARELD